MRFKFLPIILIAIICLITGCNEEGEVEMVSFMPEEKIVEVDKS